MESTRHKLSLEKELAKYIKRIKKSISQSKQRELITQVSQASIANIKIIEKSIPQSEQQELIAQVSQASIANIQSTNTEIDNIFENRKLFIQKTEQRIPEQQKLKFTHDIFDANIKLIENIAKKVSSYDTNEDELRELRKYIERQSRLAQLEKPSSLEEFTASLMWIVEKGEKDDLDLIQQIKKKPSYWSTLIKNLLEKAKINIINKLRRNTTQYKYRLFCSNEELERLTIEFTTIVKYYQFAIISASEQAFYQLKELYPIELLESEEISEYLNDFVKPDTRMKYLVLKFHAPMPVNWKELVEGTGAKVIQAAGRSECIVSVNRVNIVDKIRSLDEVQQVSNYNPKVQIQTKYLEKYSEKPVTKEEIAAARSQAARNPQQSHNKIIPVPGILIASFFTEEERNNAASNLEQEGIRIADKPGTTKLVLDVSTYDNPVDSIKIIRQQLGLRSLQEKIIPTLFNNVARYLIGENVIPANPIPSDASLGLTGEGEIIAVADTGLDTGNIETLHLDFEGRVEMIQSFPITAVKKEHIENFEDNDASDKYSGHGTHVAGSIVGNGEQAIVFGESSAPKGMAPQAKLIFQAIEKTPKWTSEGISFYLKEYRRNPPISGLFGIPDDLQALFHPAYDKGAKIHSNSWGGGIPGFYDSRCRDLDEFVWNHKDFLVIVAAGNSGKHTFSGVPGIDPESVTFPGVAKNCLTVGASENQRQGQFLDTYGQRDPYSFPYPPFMSDNMVDNIDDIAAFSSRGPCQDGRCKPDVVAPGTFVLSTRSSQIAENNFAEGYYSPAKYHYMYMSGTSMATPLVAGSGALVRQYLREKKKIINPSAALVKATIIHSAQYHNYRYAHPNSAPWADNEQGWGRVNLCTVLNPELPTQVEFIDNSKGLATGDGDEYKIEITNDTVPLRATLVYTDFPGEEGTEEQLVNNLNLTLYPPSGKYRRYYQGNDFENTGEIDNCNNVEGCIIEPDQVLTGVWTIKVVGSDVPEAPQDYALVISGGGLIIIS